MKIDSIMVGPIMTNCYLLSDETAGVCALIDPGEHAKKLAGLVNEDGVTLTHMLLTHRHYDHTTALPELAQAFPAAVVYVKQEDVCEGGSPAFYQCMRVPSMRYVQDGDTITVGSMVFTVLETPGHTPGSVVFKTAEALFTGDTLFAGSCGRVDFPGGDWGQMCASLRRLAQLPGDYKVYPGHEWTSTLENEQRSNPFMRSAQQLGGV